MTTAFGKTVARVWRELNPHHLGIAGRRFDPVVGRRRARDAAGIAVSVSEA